MYNYYNYYEAKILTEIKNLVLEEGYASQALVSTLILCGLAFALALFAAITIKRARPLGIMVAILQPIGLFASMKSVLAFAQVDFSSLAVTATGSSSDEAMSKLTTMLTEALVENVFPQLAPFCLYAGILSMITILTVVYAGILFGAKAKGFSICAFILLLVRLLFISPVDTLGVAMGTVSQSSQMVWDGFFRFMFLFPIIMMAAQGLSNLIASKKNKAPATEEASTEETAA